MWHEWEPPCRSTIITGGWSKDQKTSDLCCDFQLPWYSYGIVTYQSVTISFLLCFEIEIVLKIRLHTWESNRRQHHTVFRIAEKWRNSNTRIKARWVMATCALLKPRRLGNEPWKKPGVCIPASSEKRMSPMISSRSTPTQPVIELEWLKTERIQDQPVHLPWKNSARCDSPSSLVRPDHPWAAYPKTKLYHSMTRGIAVYLPLPT